MKNKATGPRSCASCGLIPEVGHGMYFRYTVTCDNYDGPPDEGAPSNPHNKCCVGNTVEAAIEDWNDFNDEYEHAREKA